MKVIKQSYKIMTPISDNNEVLKFIEKIGRTAYQSADKITQTSSHEFVEKIIKMKHLSVIEHYSITVKIITCRSITHELVRHRICSFLQESTRYVNSSKVGCIFIIPCWIDEYDSDLILKCENFEELVNNSTLKDTSIIWLKQMLAVENDYNNLINLGLKPQEAREILPNSTKAEIVMTANLREWRHFFELRTSKAAHPEMQLLTRPMLKEFQASIPIIFDYI
jgi:thymidylate synthase (FAD)